MSDEDSAWVVVFMRGYLPCVYLKAKNKYTLKISEAKQFKEKKQADAALSADSKVNIRRGIVKQELEGYVKQIHLKDLENKSE